MEILSYVAGALTNPLTVVLMFGGCIMGVIFGAMPGLTGTLGVTLLVPVTYSMKSEVAFPFLLSVWIGGVSGGFISATLMGIPGTTSSVATCFDAYPLSKKGQTTKALGTGILASFLGTFLSCIIAMVLAPLIAKIAVKMGPWETFSLCFCAITLVVTLSKGNLFKGLASACLGLLVRCIGMAPVDGYKRYTFGNLNLLSGCNQVGVMLGLFAVFIVVANYCRKENEYILEDTNIKIKGFGISLREIRDNLVNIVRSFIIGLWIGFLPGMGSSLSNLVAYAQAKKSSKYPEKFGTGIVDGIWASEVSNNAAVGGALIPMISMGIPGDACTAILISALTLHGLEPGPLFYTRNPRLVYLIFCASMAAAVIVVVLQFFGMRLFPRILRIPYHYLYPAIVCLCMIGAFSNTNSIFNIGLMLVFVFVALLLSIAGMPRPPFLLAFILGNMMETYMRRGLTYDPRGFVVFLTRPVSAIFLLVGVGSIVLPLVRDRLKRRFAKETK